MHPNLNKHPIILLCLLLMGVACQARPSALPAEPPNILLIISDDQRYDEMPYMPRTVSRIFDEGIVFDRAYVTTARCCPSRSSILTGLYAHNHHVILNSDPLTKPTIVEALHENNYYTGVVGKYLNSYPTQPEDPPRPEFDEWVTYISGANTAAYYDTQLNVNGVWTDHTGYQTDILGGYAQEFFHNAQAQEKPFFLMFTPYAPHLPAHPAPGDEQLYLDEPPHMPPNYNPADMSGKPNWLQALPVLTDDQIASTQKDWREQIQTLNSLDVTIERLLDELAEMGELDNTVVIFLSDNGEFLGEHRLPIGKIYVYEEATHVPFAIRDPRLKSEPRVDDEHIVANIDLAPTILELAGLSEEVEMDGRPMDGRSLVPLLQNPRAEWRSHLLLEGWPTDVAYVGNSPPFQAVHDGRYVYVETEGDLTELYDLETDPYQLRNVADDAQYADVRLQMAQYLAEERRSIVNR